MYILTKPLNIIADPSVSIRHRKNVQRFIRLSCGVIDAIKDEPGPTRRTFIANRSNYNLFRPMPASMASHLKSGMLMKSFAVPKSYHKGKTLRLMRPASASSSQFFG